MKFLVNFFGEGLRFWECYIPDKQFIEFNRLKDKHNIEWENLLFDLDFLAHFGYTHWSELSDKEELRGFPMIDQNKIEIKQQNKNILKILCTQLSNSTSLFNLYQTNPFEYKLEQKEGFKSVLLVQQETGLIGKFKIELEDEFFDIEKLAFSIVSKNKLFDQDFVIGLSYSNEPLKSIREDSLIRSFQVVWA